MTMRYECAFREHTSVYDQYRERDYVMFEDRVIRKIDGRAGVSLGD